MPLFTTELFELRVRQVYLAQEVINIYYYAEADAGGTIPAVDVCDGFNDDVMPLVEAIQNSNVTGVDIRCRRFGSVAETVLDISSQIGQRVGGPGTSFTAWGYILNRETIDMRNGAKRIAGVTEEDTVGNNPAPGIETDLDALAAVLSQTLLLNGGREIKPVIFRRDTFIDDEWFGANVSGAQFTRITSQVSRKDVVE